MRRIRSISHGPKMKEMTQRGERRERRPEGDVAEDVEAGNHVPERVEEVVQHQCAPSAWPLVSMLTIRSRPMPRLALISTRSPGRMKVFEKLAGALRVVEVVQFVVGESRFARAVEQRARALADADDGVDAPGNRAAGVAVIVELFARRAPACRR